MVSILHNSDHGVKSPVSGCGVMQLDDYHIRLVCRTNMGPIRANGLWAPGLGLLILNTPYLVIDTTCCHTCTYEVLFSLDSYEAKSHAPFSYGPLIINIS